MSMLPWISYLAAAGLAGYTNPTPQPGDASYTPGGTHHLRVIMENDSFFGEDNGYTHGTRFDYAQEVRDGHAFGLSLTQNIYTPDTKTCGNVPNEHPYAGYLALGAAYLRQGKNVGASFELQVGTTGKPSLAENSQHRVHALADMEQWKGWADQIPSEATVQLTMRQDWRLPFMERRFCNRYEMDGTFFTREQVGTVAIGGAAGLSVRYGQNLPDSMQVNGSEAGNFGMGLLTRDEYHPEELSWFVIAQGQVRFVGRDMFIDGGVFHHFDSPCSRKPWIAELQLGVAASYHGIDYYLGGVYSSRTYRTEATNPMYGTCAVTWHW